MAESPKVDTVSSSELRDSISSPIASATMRPKSRTTRRGHVRSSLSLENALIWFLRSAVFVVFISVWSLAVRREWIDEFFVSTPSAVGKMLVEQFQSGSIWANSWVTLQSVLAGFVIGSLAGIATGFLFARFNRLERVFSPYLSAINATPRVALAPLFILWFGLGQASKIWFAVSLVYFIVLIATEGGLKSIDRELTDVAKVMGLTELQQFFKVVLPGSVPAIFGGLRLGVVYSLLAVVFGEMLAATAGLGYQVNYYAGSFRMDGVLATVIVLAAMAIILNAMMLQIERKLLRWQ